MRLVHLYKKTEILKYQIAEYNDPLDYMRVAVAAIRYGQRRSNHSNPTIIFWMIGKYNQKWNSYLDLDT